MWKSALFGKKIIELFEIYGVPARTRWERIDPVQTFCGQGERGPIFLNFVRTSFKDGSLL